MSTPRPLRHKVYTDEEAKALVAKAEASLEMPLYDWQKVVLRGVLTGNSPVIIKPRRTSSDVIRRTLAHIEEAIGHGIA